MHTVLPQAVPPVARRRDIALLLLAALLSWLPFLGQLHELQPREMRHAQIAREIVASGDDLIPTLLGEMYVDKPPVVHSLMALGYSLYGEHTLWLARLPSVLAGLLAVVCVYLIGCWRQDRTAGQVAAFGLAGMTGFWTMARAAQPDMLYLAAILLATAAVVFATRPGARAGVALYGLAGVAVAVATISKGALGLVFPLLIILCLPFRSPGWRWPGSRDWAVFAVALLLAVALWLAAVAWHPLGEDYLRGVFLQPDLQLDTEAGRYPVWWYLPRLPGYCLALTLLLPWLVWDGWRRGPGAMVLLAVLMLVLLSLVAKKRPHYLLPLYPVLALAVGEAISRCRAARVGWAVVLVSLLLHPLYFGVWRPHKQEGRLDDEVFLAQQMVGRIPAQQPLFCFDMQAETTAFFAAPGQVKRWDSEARLRDLLARTSGPVWVALPEDQAPVLARLTGATLAEADRLPAQKRGKTGHWFVRRVERAVTVPLPGE